MGKRVRIWLPGVVYTLACVAGLFVIALGVLWIAGWHSPLAISNFLFIAGSLLVISAGFAAATRYEFGFVWGYWSPFRNPNNLPRGPSNGHRPGL